MLYTNGNITVTESPIFIYKEEVYKSSHNQWELLRVKKYKSNTPIKEGCSILDSIQHTYKLYKYVELQSAPKDFLISHSFKPL